MTQRTLASLILILLALLGGLWLGVGAWDPGPGTDVLASEGAGAVAPEPDATAAGPVQLERPSPRTAAAGAERAAPTEELGEEVTGVSAARRGWWRVPRGSIWIEGRVELPDGTPLDEDLWVEGRGSRFGEEAESRRTHTVKVQRDGTFQVAFSSRTRKGRLDVLGRYLYLPEKHWIKVREAGKQGPEDDGELVLEPRLGGRILVRVLPPRAAASDPTALDGVGVQATQGGFFAASEREGWSVEPGEYELGGLDSHRTYVVVATSPRFADGTVEGVEVEPGGTTTLDVPLSLGAHLAGVVLDPEGQPVNDARVMVLTSTQAAQRNPLLQIDGEGEDTTQDGRFEISGVVPGELVLVVEAEGYLDHELELGELADGGERTNLTLRLDRGRRVAGVVRWPDGTPAEGATVRIAQQASFGRNMGNLEFERIKGEVVVGPEGRFEFSALEEDPCNLTASAIHPQDRPASDSKVSRMRMKRIPRWMARAEEVAPGSLNLILTLTRGDVLGGTVVDDLGQPVEAFKVIASPKGTGMLSVNSMKPVRGRFKDEQGEFQLQGLQVGEWTVRVSAAGYADSERRPVNVPGAPSLRFVLPRTGWIEGLVKGPSGAPAKGARVTVVYGNEKSRTVTCEPDGRFSAGKVEPGPVEMVADGEGFGHSDPLELQLAAGAHRQGVVLTLTPGATITGEIHPAVDGEPGERTVSLSGTSNAQTETDDQGRFRFEGLDAGTYEVALEARPLDSRITISGGGQSDWLMRYANQKTQSVQLRSGEQVHVVLGAPSATRVQVHGRVTRGGEAVPRAMVMATDPEQGRGRPEVAVYADGEGLYSLTLDHPGPWRFQIGGDWGDRVSFMEEIPETDDVELDFQVPEARIVGTVSDPGGQPLQGIQVSLVSAETDGEQGDWLGRRFASTDAEGRFEFANLRPGKLLLRATSGDFGFPGITPKYGRVLREVEIEDENQTLELALPLVRPGTIVGEVQDPSGAPVANARLHVTDEAGRPVAQWENVRSGASGRFEYPGFAPGSYLVSATKGGGRCEARKVRVYEDGQAEVFLVLED